MWINVKDRMPEHGKAVFVRVGDAFGVAEYSKDFGFDADTSAYDIYCLDDSGMEIKLIGAVTHWMEIPLGVFE
jgi:hypothetical protein